MGKFLEFDKGEKNYTVSSRVQYELYSAIDDLAGGNVSTYIRHVLISHVRDNLDRLDDIRKLKADRS